MDSPERKRYWEKTMTVHLPLLLSSAGMQLLLLLLWLLTSFSCFFTFFPMLTQNQWLHRGLQAFSSTFRLQRHHLPKSSSYLVLRTIQSQCGSQTNTHPHSVLLKNPAHYIFPTGEIRGMAPDPKWKSETSMKAEGGFLVRPMPRVFKTWNSDLLTHVKSFLSQATACVTTHGQALRDTLSIRIPSPSRNGLHVPRIEKGSVVVAFRKLRKTGWVLSCMVHTNMKYMNWK